MELSRGELNTCINEIHQKRKQYAFEASLARRGSTIPYHIVAGERYSALTKLAAFLVKAKKRGKNE